MSFVPFDSLSVEDLRTQIPPIAQLGVFGFKVAHAPLVPLNPIQDLTPCRERFILVPHCHEHAPDLPVQSDDLVS